MDKAPPLVVQSSQQFSLLDDQSIANDGLPRLNWTCCCCDNNNNNNDTDNTNQTTNNSIDRVKEAMQPTATKSRRLMCLCNRFTDINEDDRHQSHFSDWTIQIEREESDRIDVYHVHRSFLGTGPRGSLYFFKVMKQGFVEQSNATSHVIMSDLAADAIPTMLDYMYHNDDRVQLDPYNATALFYLADYFGMDHLAASVRSFWIKDISLETVDAYFAYSKALNQQDILNRVDAVLTLSFLQVSDSLPLLDVIDDVDLWLRVVKNVYSDNYHNRLLDEFRDQVSRHWSKLATKIIEKTMCKLSSDQFLALTALSVMPEIDMDVAIRLYELEEALVNTGPDKRSCLQNRCLRTILTHASKMNFTYDDPSGSSMLPPTISTTAGETTMKVHPILAFFRNHDVNLAVEVFAHVVTKLQAELRVAEQRAMSAEHQVKCMIERDNAYYSSLQSNGNNSLAIATAGDNGNDDASSIWESQSYDAYAIY